MYKRGDLITADIINQLAGTKSAGPETMQVGYGTFHRKKGVVSSGGGGTPIRNAFCKNDAGGGKYIQVYLDTNLTGEQVYVECTLIGATNLSQCFPTLTEGVRIPVWFDSTHWRCLWWFQGYDVCAEPGE